MLYRYAGPCSEPKLTQAAAEVRQAVSKMEAALQRHLFASFIELFQNVDRYGVSHDEGDAERPYGEISITRITTGSSQIHAANLTPPLRGTSWRRLCLSCRGWTGPAFLSCIMNSCQNHV